jgi:hypothetical protein
MCGSCWSFFTESFNLYSKNATQPKTFKYACLAATISESRGNVQKLGTYVLVVVIRSATVRCQIQCSSSCYRSSNVNSTGVPSVDRSIEVALVVWFF